MTSTSDESNTEIGRTSTPASSPASSAPSPTTSTSPPYPPPGLRLRRRPKVMGALLDLEEEVRDFKEGITDDEVGGDYVGFNTGNGVKLI